MEHLHLFLTFLMLLNHLELLHSDILHELFCHFFQLPKQMATLLCLACLEINDCLFYFLLAYNDPDITISLK